jgi:DNA helicase-2/ATP-dependent DNA helicase PcrA
MPSRLPLTEQQQRAAATTSSRAFIEAAPGSGKTTVAAERYGVLRYGHTGDGHCILGVSFTRSATNELKRRITGRWGTGALTWPHRTMTLDTLHADIVGHLLRTGRIQWPGGHTDLQVLDVWRGRPGSRYLTPGNLYRRVAALRGTQVTSASEQVTFPGYGIGARDSFEQQLAAGVCTHGEIRQVLAATLEEPGLRAMISKHLAETLKAVVVDEVFDADGLDLQIVMLVCEAGIPVTLIGDPWQALYGFRGARPELVPGLLTSFGFSTYPVSESFRFETAQMRQLASALRAGQPVHVAAGNVDEVDVVLASKWAALWEGPEIVLPLSFGMVDNHTEAAMVLLVHWLTTGHFSHEASYLREAIALLGLDRETVDAREAEALTPVIQTLASGRATATAEALRQLRDAVLALGGYRRPRQLGPAQERKQLRRLEALRKRLGQSRRLLPGMTVHQAKGREWAHVGVRLTDDEQAQLAAGLSQDNDDHRRLYVALTRARRSVTLIR